MSLNKYSQKEAQFEVKKKKNMLAKIEDLRGQVK